jgi:hypothetical protein
MVKSFSLAISPDDNKKAIKKILEQVIAWQRANGFPLTFVTEASMDLADDLPELLRLPSR